VEEKMKKISIIFLLFTVLMTAIFTSCEDPTTTMEPLTEDMIDEWIIGTWDVNTIIETKIGEQSQTTNTTEKYEIENLENDMELILLKSQIFIKEGTNYSVLVNKARTRIEMSSSVIIKTGIIDSETHTTLIMTKR
jgi:hypothetical protein